MWNEKGFEGRVTLDKHLSISRASLSGITYRFLTASHPNLAGPSRNMPLLPMEVQEMIIDQVALLQERTASPLSNRCVFRLRRH